mmetsp:Transcript_70571/g.206549  ORF Transcript_70571/g.206549 Transcript_70571/m.206549 type:complete len:273 (-) Transcript_70571:792-1610(-)
MQQLVPAGRDTGCPALIVLETYPTIVSLRLCPDELAEAHGAVHRGAARGLGADVDVGLVHDLEEALAGPLIWLHAREVGEHRSGPEVGDDAVLLRPRTSPDPARVADDPRPAVEGLLLDVQDLAEVDPGNRLRVRRRLHVHGHALLPDDLQRQHVYAQLDAGSKIVLRPRKHRSISLRSRALRLLPLRLVGRGEGLPRPAAAGQRAGEKRPEAEVSAVEQQEGHLVQALLEVAAHVPQLRPRELEPGVALFVVRGVGQDLHQVALLQDCHGL